MLTDIIALSRQAGDAIMAVHEDDVEVTLKADDSPVTQADMAAHQVIVSGLERLDPHTPLISEEGHIPTYEQRKDWETFWIVDPLDGTKEFIKGTGEFTVNIAKIDAGVPVLGVVYAPTRNRLYYAERGRGAWKQEGNSDPHQIFSEPADPDQPLVVATSRSHGAPKLEAYLDKLNVQHRIYAGSSLKFCLVAEGKADIYPRMGPTMEWDVAAGDCVYRHSARNGQHASSLTYNKPQLRNEGFVVGF